MVHFRNYSQRVEGVGAVGGPSYYRPVQAPQHYRPGVPPYAAAASNDNGIFSTISNGLNSLYSNIFG